MSKLLKRTVVIVAVPAVLVLIALGGLMVLLYRSVPAAEGELVSEHLSAPVRIAYDEYQRPYVQAETLADALYAEGYLHGTHRLWQMDLFRRAAHGRLSELLGSGLIESDKELWRIGVPQLAQRLEANATAELQALVQAYVHGVNAALEANPNPPEYLLLRADPVPWTPSDVYGLGALMAFQSAGNLEEELLRMALFEELGEERARVFLPRDGDVKGFPYVMPRMSRGKGGSPVNDVEGDHTAGLTGRPPVPQRAIAALRRLAAVDALDAVLFPSFAFGSNSWVVAPERSATGHALFAFDSHDAFGLPNLFYEVHLFYGVGREIRGWSVAGLPGVVNGYNERIAWGFTNIGDSQDLFLETRSESDPLQFKDGDLWYTAETETVEILVNGREDPETFVIVHTKNGPLISEDPPIALRWAVQDIGELGLDSLLDLNRARTWEEFTDALDRFAAPPLNATYADVDGNIGFRTAGMLPVRARGEGLLPLTAADPANRWQGYIPPADLPQRFNPPEGFIAAANARVNAAGDGPLISADNAPGYRIRRIVDVLEHNDALSVDDMRALQVDWYDTQAALLLPAMLAEVDVETLDNRVRTAFERVIVWQDDPVAYADSPAPLIFQAWYRHLAKHLFEPELSEEMFSELFKNNYVLNHAVDRLLLDEADSDWWRGDRAAILTQSLREAVAEIAGQLGTTSPLEWRLDQMHRLVLKHELGSAVPQLAWFFNADPAPWGGGPATVGRARYRYDRAYDISGGATVRVVGNMTNPPEMQAVMPAGQSGHTLSKHYLDQQRHWLAGELLTIWSHAEAQSSQSSY